MRPRSEAWIEYIAVCLALAACTDRTDKTWFWRRMCVRYVVRIEADL